VVAAKAAEADFPEVQRELDRRVAAHDPEDWAAAGYAKWASLRPMERGGIPGLLECIDEAHVSWISRQASAELPPPGFLPFKEGLKRVVYAEQFYWACFAFEAVLFGGLLWFLFSPYVSRSSLRRKLIHAAGTPLLLYVPYWLGYCNSASPAFPIGGILYPYLAWPAAFLPANFKWEFSFLAKLPPVFGMMTQGRTVTFADYATLVNWYPNQMGPVNVSICSFVFAAVAAACHVIAHVVETVRTKRRARPGFPVLAHGSSPE
jgi:hypothetical protein